MSTSIITDQSRGTARNLMPRVGFVYALLCLLLTGCGGSPVEQPMEEGRAAYADTDYPRAFAAFRKAVEADGGNLQARLALAETQEKLQDWEGAFENFSAVAAGDASNIEARFKTGQLLLVKRDAEGLRKTIAEL